MKPNPVAPIRLLLAVLIPLAVLAAASSLLVSLADAQTNVPIQPFRPPLITESAAHEFTQQDTLLMDADGDGRASPGDIIQYTLSFANHSPNAVTGLNITDTVDANTIILDGSLIVSPLAFDDAETAVINTPLTIPAPGLFTNDDLHGPDTAIASYDAATAQGGSVIIQPDGGFHYQPPADFTGDDSFSYTLTNTTGSDTAVVHLTILHSDLSIGKSVSNPAPFAGDSITYTVRITNEGSIPLTNIIISDTLPTGLTYQDHQAPANISYNPAAGLWNVPSLETGQSADLIVNMTVDAGTAGQTITNTAVLQSLDQTDANPHNNSATATLTVQPKVDIALNKTVNNSTPLAGDTIIYTITATNLGPDVATGVEVTDVLPAGITFVNSNQASFVPPIWAIGSLDANQTVMLRITAIVNDVTAGSIIKNTAAVTAVSQTDSNPNNNSASTTITIREEPAPVSVDIALSKTVDNKTPLAGDTIIYTITAANLGPNDATGVEVTDALPNGVTFVSSDQASFVPPVWTIGNLDANQTATLKITVTVNEADAGNEIENTAAVKAVSQPDSNPNNDSSSATITIHEEPAEVDIALNKSVNNPTPLANDTIIYTITASNNGPDNATGVQVTDLLPTGVTHISSLANRGSYTAANGIWTIGNLNQAQDAVLTITATVNSETAVSTITNTAALTAVNENDSNPNNDSANATITIHETITDVDIALNKTVNNNTPRAGDTIVYTITATNLGTDDATGVEVTDVLPNGVTFVSSDQTSFILPVWSIGSLDANETATLNITVMINDVVPGSGYTNIATLTAVSQPDTNPNNNSASAAITVHKAPTAVDDDPGDNPAYQVTAGATLDQPNGANDPVERNDDVGFPVAAIISFGGGTLGGTVTNQNAGSTVAPLPTFSDGSLTIYANGRFIFTPPTGFLGDFQFRYRLSNNAGTSDATVTIRVQEDTQEAPDAVDDPNSGLPADSTPGNTPYHLHAGSSNNVITGLLNNDTLGNPAAALTHFGGGSLGGSATDYTAGQTAASGGHTLRVNDDGTLTYTPPAAFTGLFTFQYRLTNPSGTDDATVTIAVGARPSCTNDNYTATGNIAINHTASTGVLANDSEDVAVTAVQNGAVGTAQNSSQNGIITLHVDGRFVYDPPPGFNGQDSFTYTVNNGFADPQTCTATITISDMVWFIDSSASGSNLGTLSHPFTSIAAFNNAKGSSAVAPAAGDLIYLLQGNGYNESDGIHLLNNQRLIGQRIDLKSVINTNATFNLPPSGPAHTPLLQTTGSNGVDLAANNTIRGLDIGDTPAGFALEGTAVSDLTINQVNITGTGGALRIDGGTFDNNVSFETLESTASPAQNVQLTGVMGSLNVSSGGAGLSGAADTAVAISGGTLNFNYPGSITQNANFATVEVTNGHSGSLTFGGSVNATNGTGLQFDNAFGVYTLNGTTTLNEGTQGIKIIDSDGTFTFDNATITDPSATSFWLQSSTVNLTYSGSIDDAYNTAVYIWNSDDSTITFQSGSITSTGRGITVRDTNRSTINFNSNLDLDTASDDALVLTNNDNSTINFTGNINIKTTTQAGFRAVGGGTVNATGNNNIINTTNRGTAVIISDTTTIGPSNITFRTINTNEASSGIILDDTGELGALIVTHGGTINNSTGDGISIRNGNISLNQMNIQSNGGHGISAQLDGNTNMHVQLTNNTISSGSEGIFVDVGAGSNDNGRMDLIMSNNAVNTPLNTAAGTHIQSHAETTLCADLSDNQSIGNEAPDFHLGRYDSSIFYLQDFATDVRATLLNKGNSKTGGGVVEIDPVGEPFAEGIDCNSAPTGLHGNNRTIHETLSGAFPAAQIPCVPPLRPCASALNSPATSSQINHTIKTLPPGKTITLRFNVQINNPFPVGSEYISSQAIATATAMPAMYSDDPDTAVSNDPTITPIATIKLAYLPLILHNVTTLPDWPDLIVESISATHDDLTVVLKNSGTAPVTDEFWVDAYFNPNLPPTGVNQTIQTLDVDGIVWGVDSTALPIAPGEMLTLTLNSPYYDAQNSRFNGTIPAGELYVQVDSANTATTYGAVLEVHEAAGGAYNNIAATTASHSVIIALDNTYGQALVNNLLGKRP